MNQALNFFQTDPKIFSISGYSPDLPHLKHYYNDYYLSLRASSWGWGTWKEGWATIDWKVEDYDQFKFNLLINLEFARGGSDLPGMLRDQKRGKIDSWAIRWVYQQFKNKQFTVYPKISKVQNIGIGEHATHTKKVKRFETKLDFGCQSNFQFEKESVPNSLLIKEFKSIFSFRRRFLDRF